MNISKKLKVQLNGNNYRVDRGCTINKLLKRLKINNNKAAVELNGQIADKKRYSHIKLKKNDRIEIVHFIGGGLIMIDKFTVAKKIFKSRLIVGTGKYKSFKETAKAIKASGSDMVTVAVRRVNITD